MVHQGLAAIIKHWRIFTLVGFGRMTSEFKIQSSEDRASIQSDLDQYHLSFIEFKSPDNKRFKGH